MSRSPAARSACGCCCTGRATPPSRSRTRCCPGLVVASLAGAPLLLGAAGGVLVAAVAIALAGRDERLGGDVGVAVAISALFGLGALLALSPDVPARLGELLFGDLLGVTGGDLARPRRAGRRRRARAGARAPAVGAERRSTAPPRRRSAPRPARWELALLALLAICTVAAVQGLGNLLVVALILAPAAAALNFAQRLRRRARAVRGASPGWPACSACWRPTTGASRPAHRSRWRPSGCSWRRLAPRALDTRG